MFACGFGCRVHFAWDWTGIGDCLICDWAIGARYSFSGGGLIKGLTILCKSSVTLSNKMSNLFELEIFDMAP